MDIQDTENKTLYKLTFIDTISRQEIDTLTLYAEDSGKATARGYDIAGERGYDDVKVKTEKMN